MRSLRDYASIVVNRLILSIGLLMPGAVSLHTVGITNLKQKSARHRSVFAYSDIKWNDLVFFIATMK